MEAINLEYTDEWKLGFVVARTIRTILTRRGVKPSQLPPTISLFYPVITEVFDADVALSAAGLWSKVETAEGEGWLDMALAKATTEVDGGGGIEVAFPFPSKEQERLAKIIAGAAKILTESRGGCFLPTHLIGGRLGYSYETVARILRVLRNQNVLELTAAATQRQAAEYEYRERPQK